MAAKPPKLVHVRRDDTGICEVLERCRLAVGPNAVCNLEHQPYALAVKEVRMRVFELYGQKCVYCGVDVTWFTFHLHEAKLRRGQGGHYSVDQSVVACPPCHKDEHPEKKLYWSKRLDMTVRPVQECSDSGGVIAEIADTESVL